MKTKIIIILISISSSLLHAEEGMWLPQLLKSLNEVDMHNVGLKLSADDLYNINQSSLKDAIVSFGGFCTGEMISEQGLLLTNHHCGYGQIQKHSDTKNDYLKSGFWAMSKGDELPNEGLTASFLINIEDVTDLVLDKLEQERLIFDSLSSTKETLNKTWNRSSSLRKVYNEIVSEKTSETHYNARVKSFFGGNEFYLFTYETFKDVRLVGAPPNSIGAFGGDTDNWMWPRHTGDFALFRVYCGPDGKPAEYAIENVPYKPKHHLPIQLDGVKNNDFTMIFGYPGSTNRFLTSFGVKEALNLTNPTIVKIRDAKINIIKPAMDSDIKTKIKYAAKYARISNYWKYYIGQSKGLRRMKVYEKKLDLENKFNNWCVKDSLRNKKYGSALQIIENAYSENEKIAISRTFLNEGVFSGAEIMYFSLKMHRAINRLPKESEMRESALRKIRVDANNFYKNFNAEIDQKLFASMLELYYYNVPKNQHPDVFQTIERQLFGIKKLDFKFYANNSFNRSIFSSKDKFFNFLKNPLIINIEKDPIYKTINSIYSYYLENIYEKRQKINNSLFEGQKLFIQGLREMMPENKFYPDANSTMRLTYGSVADYSPGNAIHYNYFTTIEGIIEKEDTTNDEFLVHEKLKSLYNEKDYGKYVDDNGSLRVNFISNNDITGGNSGSPVINAHGELVGTAFDGNWEAMSGDIAFENAVQRTISVDIRYVLFIIDKFANAGYLIDEMTIAPSRKKNNIR